MQRKRRSIRTMTIQSLTGLESKDLTCRNSSFYPKNKTSCEFSIQNTLNLSKNQKALDVLESLQKELIENYSEDIAKQIGSWINRYKKQKERQMSISFSPHTLQLIDMPFDEQRIPRIIETIKKLMMHVDLLNCPTDELENRALELIESQFIIIYTKIENAFDEEATIDLSTQNTYIHLKGRRAFKLLHEFCDVFTENEPIYKILPLSKSESFQTMQKLNKYIKLFILKEEENININKILSDLNMEKINIYLTIVERVQSSLDTITKNFKTHVSALETVLKNIQSSEMIQPFYDAKIDYNAAPEEATTSISMSKNTFMFSERNGNKRKSTIIANNGTGDIGLEGQRSMEMIEESDEDYDDDDDEDYLKQSQQDSYHDRNIPRSNRHHKSRKQSRNESDILVSTLDKFQFSIEYLKPGNIPWDLQTIRSEGKIGSGGQGTVFRAFDPKKERQIALKFTNLPMNWESQKDNYLQEIRIQSYMTCKKMSHIIEVDNKVYIYQDKYGQQQKYLISQMELGVGSLEDLIKISSYEHKTISDRQIFHIFFDIIQGLEQMHKLDYGHKDIKPQNIIYSIKDKYWKIADFGCIQRIETQSLSMKRQSSVITPGSSHTVPLKRDSSFGSTGSPAYNSAGNIGTGQKSIFAQECFVTGTPSYMSPELYALYQQRQESGLVNLIANDYYSLGITLLKLREMEKIERAKLNEKIIINKLSSDRLSKLITILLNEDQVFRSSLSLSTFIEMFANEYKDYLDSNKDDEFNYLETIFKYDENAQDNLNITQKLECAKTYQNINLREKCLKFFDEIVNDPEFEKLDIFEKRNILVEYVQALSYFGDYERAYEQGIKCLNISTEQLKGFCSNELIISDLKNVGQILFNQGQYDQALQKYLQVLDIIRDDQEKKQKIENEAKSQMIPPWRKSVETQVQGQRRTTKKTTGSGQVIERKSTFHRTKVEQQGIPAEEIDVEMCHSDKDSEKGKELSLSDKIIENKNNDMHEENDIDNKYSNLNINSNKKINLSDSFNNDANSQNKSFLSDINDTKLPTQFINRQLQNGLVMSINSLADLQNDSVLTTSNGKASQTEINKSSQFENSVDQNRQSSFQDFINKPKSNPENILSSNSQNSKNNSMQFLDKMLDEDNKRELQNKNRSNSDQKEKEKDIQIQHLNLLEPIEENPHKRIQNIQQMAETPTVTGNEITNMSFSTSLNRQESYLTKQTKNSVVLQAMEYDNSLGKFQQEGVSQEIQNDLAQIQTLIGQALNKLGHYDKALKYYEEALKTTEKNLGKNYISVAVILDSMGESLVSNGRYKESFRIFKRSYKIKRNEYGRNSIYLAETIGQMGKVLEKLTLYEKSAQHYTKALQIFEQHYGQNHIKTAEILNHLGNVKRAEGNYKQAYQLYLEVLTIMSNHYPSDHIEIGKIYHDIGNVLRNQENLELSLEYFLKAEEIKIKYHGTNHVEVSNTWQYIGIIYRKMEKLDLAQQYFELALAPMENHFGKEHIEVIKLIQEIAVLMQLQGHLQLAKEKLEFVLNNRIKEFGYYHIKTANTMQNVATIEMELGNYSQSLDYNQKVLVVRKQTFGENHLKVANSITSIAQLYDLMGDYSHALQNLDNAINIYKLDLPTNKGKILQANIIRASILYNTLNLKEAQNLLEVDLLPNIKPSSVNYQQAYTLLSYIYQLQSLILEDEENDNEWLIMFKEKISDGASRDYKLIFNNLKQIIQNILLESEKTYGKEHISYALVLEQNGLFNLNIEQVKSAISIKLKRYTESHKEILNSKQLICQIEYLKAKEENTPLDSETDLYKSLVERLTEIVEEKEKFYSNNSHHIQLFNSLLLLYRITKDEKYKERILSVINYDPQQQGSQKSLTSFTF